MAILESREIACQEGKKLITRKKGNRILFAVSPSGWAYDLRCQALKRYLSRFYDIKKNSNKFATKHGHNYDLIYIAGFETMSKLASKHYNVCSTIGGLVSKSITQAISVTRSATATAVPNLAWYNSMRRKVGRTRKLFYITNGVDTSMFTPEKGSHKNFIIGWVGNDRTRRLKIKRIDILRQVCKDLKIRLIEQNWSHNKIPHNRMPGFYKKIDLYINVSTTEGSNNPILEACSAGVPVLATRVGNVPQLVSSGVVPLKRNLGDLEAKIKMFAMMPRKERRTIGANLRARMIRDFDWSTIAAKYKIMFDYCLGVKR